MSMGGSGPEVLATFTEDIGQLLEGLHRTKIRGDAHLSASIQVAHVSIAAASTIYHCGAF